MAVEISNQIHHGQFMTVNATVVELYGYREYAFDTTRAQNAFQASYLAHTGYYPSKMETQCAIEEMEDRARHLSVNQ